MTISLALARKTMAVALGLAALPAMAASGFSFSNLSGAEYDTAGVFVKGDYTFTATTDDGGGFDLVVFKLWDDFVVKFEQTSSLAVGSTGTFHFETWYPGLVGTAARGVGLYLYDGGSYATYIDPYDVPHYSDPSQCTTDCGPVGAVPEPESYAMLLAGLGLLGMAQRRRQAKK